MLNWLFRAWGNDTKHIELLSVRKAGAITYANVFVPERKLEHFENYVAEYLADRKGKSGQSLDHKALLHTIASIRRAELHALWTDEPTLLPEDAGTAFWWEVWLPVRNDWQRVVEDFRKLAWGVMTSPSLYRFVTKVMFVCCGKQASGLPSALHPSNRGSLAMLLNGSPAIGLASFLPEIA